MQRRDLVIGLVGALVVLGTTAFVAARGGTGEAAFDMTFPVERVHVGEGNRAHFNEGAFTDSYALKVSANATFLFVNASVDSLGAPQGSAHAVLRSPTGREVEASPSVSGTTGGQRTFSLSFALDTGASPPPEATCRKASACLPSTQAASTQTWTLEVSFSSRPLAAASATTSWQAEALAWHAEIAPRAPGGK